MALNLKSEITLDSSKFEAGINKVTSSVASSVKAYALGAIGVYSLEKAFYATIETSKELVTASKRMGVSIEQLQVMRKAAASAGVEMEGLAGALEKLNEFRAKALGGGAEGDKALQAAAQVGVSKEDLTKRNAQDILFNVIGKNIRGINPQQLAAPLKEILGKSFGEMIPVITKDMGAIQEKMESLGMIISTKTAKELVAFNSAMGTFKNIMVTALAPVVAGLAEKFLELLSNGSLVSKAFEGLVFWWREFSGEGKKKANLANKLQSTFESQQKAIPKDKLTMSLISQNGGNVTNAAAEAAVQDIKSYGSETEKMLLKDFKGEFGDKDFAKKFSAFLGSLRGDASKSVADNSNASASVIEGIQETLKNWKNTKDETPAPDFTAEIGANEAPKQQKGGLQKADSMVSVGNFLGTNVGLMNGISNRMEKHAAETAKNTAKTAAILDAMQKKPVAKERNIFDGIPIN